MHKSSFETSKETQAPVHLCWVKEQTPRAQNGLASGQNGHLGGRSSCVDEDGGHPLGPLNNPFFGLKEHLRYVVQVLYLELQVQNLHFSLQYPK